MVIVADLASPSSSEFRVPSPIYHGQRTDNLRGSDDTAVKRSKRGTKAALRCTAFTKNMGNQLHWNYGEVRERLNRAVSKTVEPLRVPWVRIPPSPPARIRNSQGELPSVQSWPIFALCSPKQHPHRPLHARHPGTSYKMGFHRALYSRK